MSPWKLSKAFNEHVTFESLERLLENWLLREDESKVDAEVF